MKFHLVRLAGVLIQTQIAHSSFLDADTAIEAPRLAKQQILARAAMQMILLALAQKQTLVHMLM